MTTKQEAIDNCLNGFRFDRVHRVMVELDWGWATTDMKPPGVYDIMAFAWHLLDKAWDQQTTIESGGLRAIYVPASEIEGESWGPDLELLFVAESAASY